MIDREKVLKGLECCCAQDSEVCGDCPYTNPMKGMCDSLNEILRDALTVLKAQEPVTPTVGHDGWYRCGHCNNPLASGERVNSDGFFAHPWPRYCEMCGRAVKWE